MTSFFRKAVRWCDPRESDSLPPAVQTDRRSDYLPIPREETGRILMIPSDRILPNPAQPRQQFEDGSIIGLADSIRRYGILQPLTVRRPDGHTCDCLYELIAGERRLRAAKLLNMASVPCIVIHADGQRSAELAIIENIQRENLNIFEQAGAIASLIDMYELTQEEVARRLSMSQSSVANKLRILRLTAPEREKILTYALTERHARALLKVDSIEMRLRIIDYIGRHALRVDKTEEYIDRLVRENDIESNSRKPRKIILKDIRLFYNSVERAVSICKQAGVNVESERCEDADAIEWRIRIPKLPPHTQS